MSVTSPHVRALPTMDKHSLNVQESLRQTLVAQRLNPLGVLDEELLDVYDKQIRCIVEYASPVWTPGLTQAEIIQIERVQKAAFAIILEKRYSTYSAVLKLLDRKTLKQRRLELNLRFAKKCLLSQKYNHWFQPCTPSNQMLKSRSVKQAGLAQL